VASAQFLVRTSDSSGLGEADAQGLGTTVASQGPRYPAAARFQTKNRLLRRRCNHAAPRIAGRSSAATPPEFLRGRTATIPPQSISRLPSFHRAARPRPTVGGVGASWLRSIAHSWPHACPPIRPATLRIDPGQGKKQVHFPEGSPGYPRPTSRHRTSSLHASPTRARIGFRPAPLRTSRHLRKRAGRGPQDDQS
jgi:hypothetical protein